MGCFVVTEFLLTSVSRGPSAIAELLVECGTVLDLSVYRPIAEQEATGFKTLPIYINIDAYKTCRADWTEVDWTGSCVHIPLFSLSI